MIELLTTVRGLPDGAPEAPSPPVLPPPARAAASVANESVASLRRRVRAQLSALAVRLDAQLPSALAASERAWESADDHALTDEDLRADFAETRRAVRAAAAQPPGPARAAALEAWLALESAWGLLELAERRLATLIRLRVRADGSPLTDQPRNLLPDGRPFLDLGRALHQLARHFA